MSRNKRTPEQKAADRCSVVRDLMVLCADGMASDASWDKVERHVKTCPPCSQVWEDMKSPAVPAVPTVPVEDPQFEQAVRMVRKKQKWRSVWKVLLGVVLAVIAVLAGLAAWWYWLEPVEMMTWQHYYSLQARYTADGQMYIRAENVPENAGLEVRFNPDTGSLRVWATTSRAKLQQGFEAIPLGCYDYFIGTVEKTESTDPAQPRRKLAVTDPKGVTYRFWLDNLTSGSVESVYDSFLEEETNAKPLTDARRAHITKSEWGYIMAAPTPRVCYEVVTQDPHLIETDRWEEPPEATVLPNALTVSTLPPMNTNGSWLTPAPQPAEAVQTFPVCTAEPSAQIN